MSMRVRILLVSNPAESEDIARTLREAGLEDVSIGGGGDETLARCSELAPQVVVLSASLDQGDARSMASAIRAARGDSVRIVLVGDTTGPIRNALDAADFEVDRFVGRPLSGKALAFAVRACAAETSTATPTPTSTPTPTPTGTGTGAGTGTVTDAPGAAASDASTAQAPQPPVLEQAMEDAINRFVADAMDALDAGWTVDAGVDAPPAAPAAPLAASSEETAKVSDPQDVPGWREPTLILSGGRVAELAREAAAAQQAVPARADLDVTAPQSSSPWDEDDEDDDDGDDPIEASTEENERSEEPLDLELDEDSELDDQESEPRASAPAPAPAENLPGPSGNLGRELRRKMSMMAERLFPGRPEKAPVDIGLAHDAHTDIDLTAIVVEPAAVRQAAPYEEIGSADTFADTNPLSKLEPTPSPESMQPDEEETTGRRRAVTSEPPARGDLAELDVATLLGRLLQSRFTGRVQFRRADAEKVVHFDEGRPIFASSNLPHDRMGDLLFREGKITREQQARARDSVVESGRRMGEILVEMGFLKPRELMPAVRHHIEDIVYSLFAWHAGEFSIAAGDPPGERIRLTRHPAALVLEGVRRKYGHEFLEARLGSSAAVIAARTTRQLSAISAVADLSAAERSVMQKLDGERTIEQAAEAAQVDRLVALQIAFGLVALGVAEVVDHGPLPVERPLPARGRALVGETDLAIDRQRVLAKHALVIEADYFTLLGVRRDATSFEIRRAYEAARRDYAAVVFPPELQRELAGELSEIGQIIEEAYQVLRDERVRRAYQSNLLD